MGFGDASWLNSDQDQMPGVPAPWQRLRSEVGGILTERSSSECSHKQQITVRIKAQALNGFAHRLFIKRHR